MKQHLLRFKGTEGLLFIRSPSFCLSPSFLWYTPGAH
jgi:hypothetical protein